jgi:hypothetical protein
MAWSYGWFPEPTDIMEHIAELKFYYMDDEAKSKLELIAKYIDDPQMLKDLEEEWLYRGKTSNSNNKTEPLYKGIARTFGWDWD